MRSVSCTKFDDHRDALRRWVRDEIQTTFPGRSEREICERASLALSLAPGTIRAHLRCEIQKPDVAIALICRAMRGARIGGRIYEAVMGAA